jgi:hypothetical protein
MPSVLSAHLRVSLAALIIGFVGSQSVSWAAEVGLTTMPSDVPNDSRQYLSKWDPLVLQPLVGTKETLSRNNGRQVARDAAGRCFLLVERDRQSLWLGLAAGPRTVGGDVEWVELVGPSPEAIFNATKPPVGGSMVIDRNDRLHVVWCQSGRILCTSRSVKDASPKQLRQKQGWQEIKTIAGPSCDLGDILLDASGQPAVCYCRDDVVYYQPLDGAKAEVAGGAGSGMPPLVTPEVTDKGASKRYDPAAPPAQTKKTPSWPPPRPREERQCQEAAMDLGPDGSIHLVFQREFDIWYARRTPQGKWLPPERAAWGLAFHPAIIVADDRPLICFQHEGLRRLQLGSKEYLRRREGGGASIGYAVKTAAGWHTDYLAKAEEIVVNRQGIWEQRFEGQLVPMLEEMWRPVLFRDGRGVTWALWQNTTRRWAYAARWLGERFGQVQECRGPFCAPGEPVGAEKLAPAGADDVGLLMFAAGRVLFDRLKIPALSLADNREILFLDALEVARTEGLQFLVNPMSKDPANPVFSPGPIGTKDDRRVSSPQVRKHGKTYVMRYSYQSWETTGWSSDGLAISDDGIQWRRVERLPKDLPPADGDGRPADPVARGYFDNPDQSDPAKKFMHVGDIGLVWHHGSKRVLYSADGQHWTDGPEISALNAIYEGGTPNLWDPLDIPERRIKVYGRVYSSNSRSCGLMWTDDLLHWHGAEHHLDPDNPYVKRPAKTSQGPLRGQIFLDACAGKGEDQIYVGDVHRCEGLYLCLYWPCSAEHRIDGALAVSRDGLNFTRVQNGSRTLPVGSAGAWDSGIVQLALPQRDGDRMWLYFGGSAWHHGVEPYMPALQIGRATIRTNGWTYFTPDADAERGSLTTIPIDAAAGHKKRLTVNVEGTAADRPAIAVEVLDAATGQPLPGFAAADCIAPSTDGVAAPVAWKGGAAIPTGKPLRLRFVLTGKGVRLYSFGFKPL